MKKFKDKREYSPNYESIEKHLPRVNLNTKSQRIFPIKFIKINNIGELVSDKRIIEPKKLLRKNNSTQSIFFKNMSTCSLFKNFINIKNNSIINDKKSFKENIY